MYLHHFETVFLFDKQSRIAGGCGNGERDVCQTRGTLAGDGREGGGPLGPGIWLQNVQAAGGAPLPPGRIRPWLLGERGTISLSGNRRAREKHQGLERPNGMQLECHHACDAERQLLQQIVRFFDRRAVHDEYDAQS